MIIPDDTPEDMEEAYNRAKDVAEKIDTESWRDDMIGFIINWKPIVRAEYQWRRRKYEG